MYFNYTILFAQFMINYDKIYGDNEFLDRYNIFKENYQQIQFYNLQNNTFKLGINEYADLTIDEWYRRFNSLYLNKNSICSDFEYQNSDLPQSVDWREEGIVTPIRNQRNCGSCWAFATASATESTWIQGMNRTVATNLTDYYLSPQQLVDCSTEYGNEGCSGGYIDNTFEYIIDRGLCLESEYKYTGEDNSCNKCNSAIRLKSCYDIPQGNQLALKHAVAIRPVVISVEADNFIFRFYESGIITDSECGTELDHAIVIVGYGEDTETNMKYWIVRNSWGTTWGENGYIRIERSESEDDVGICGIASFPVMVEI